MEIELTKKTALFEKHIALGAKMVPFAGYDMPLQYSGLTDEHFTVRNQVGLFDVSHMGTFILKGPEALNLVQKVTSNDASKLFDGKVQYSCLMNKQGGIIDDLLVYRIDEQTYMMVPNASNIDKDFDWISEQNTYDVDIKNISDRTALMALQGPLASEVLSKLTDLPLKDMPYYTFKKGIVNRIENVLVSTTGYTGAGGFEIYVDHQYAEQLWDALLQAGLEYGIKPTGLGCRDTLRLEMGYCLYGNDINDETTPLEAGLGWITKLKKDFIGKDVLLKQKEEGIKQKLVGFEMIERGIPRSHYELCDAQGNNIGEVTSGTMSPILKKGIGLGYVQINHTSLNQEIFVKVRDKLIKAKVTELPFYKAS